MDIILIVHKNICSQDDNTPLKSNQIEIVVCEAKQVAYEMRNIYFLF
jgi:hypothetical protein